MLVSHSKARYISFSAAIALCGVIFSGPVAVGLAYVFAPQPFWQGVDAFVQNYSWLQTLPYLFGFLIVGGFILFMASLSEGVEANLRPLGVTALVLTSVFAALIFTNYLLQTTFIPLWVRNGNAILGVVTMENPESLGWSLELFGYGILGIAMALISPVFQRKGRQGAIRVLLQLNCVVSVVSAVLFPLVPGWVLTSGGLIAGVLWSLLIALLMILVMLEFKFGRSIGEGRSGG